MMDSSSGVTGPGPGVPHVWWTHDESGSDWTALETFLSGSAAVAAAIEPSEFMWMAEVLLSSGVVIHFYKHTMTRRYLFLGDDGHAYWASAGCYLKHASHADAVAALELAL
jgi:hypothetical protein